MRKVLVTAPYFQPVVARYREWFADKGYELVVPRVEERLEEDELLVWLDGIEGVISGDDRFTERVLARASQLKVIAKWGTGIDSIDREAAARLGIAVRNTPDAFTGPVADSVLGYILAFARRLPWMDRDMKNGAWTKVPCCSLAELTLGVIGVGHIGKAVVRRAQAFGMRLLGNDLLEMPESFVAQTGIEMMARDRLLAEADFVSLNCDLNPTSRRLIDDAALAKMKPSAVLINLARGPIVDEPALVRALQAQRIAGCALDVYEHEPLPVESPLRGMDNVMLAPHNSNSSPRAWERIHESTVRNLLEILEQTR